MKEKICKKYRVFSYVSAVVAVVLQVVLPWAVTDAYVERGYFSIGGEWAIGLLSLMAMMVFITNINKWYALEIEGYRERIKTIQSKASKAIIEDYDSEKAIKDRFKKAV